MKKVITIEYEAGDVSDEVISKLIELNIEAATGQKPILKQADVSGSSPITKAEFKKLMKALYPADRSRKLKWR